MEKIKKGDETDFGKVVATFRVPTYVISFSIKGFHQRKIDYIIDKFIDLYLQAFVGNEKMFVFGGNKFDMYEKIENYIPKDADEFKDAIAITDRDVIIDESDTMEENINKSKLKQLIREVLNESKKDEYKNFIIKAKNSANELKKILSKYQ